MQLPIQNILGEFVGTTAWYVVMGALLVALIAVFIIVRKKQNQ